MRIGLVGLGFMGATHLQALERVRGATLAAVVSSDDRRLAGDLTAVGGNFAHAGAVDLSGVQRYRRVDEALADDTLDALDLCVPTDRHAELAVAAMRAGKHVLVEKPMALDARGAELMLTTAADTGRVLMVGHAMRFHPQLQAARDLVATGRLGHVRAAYLRRTAARPSWNAWMSDPARSGGAVFDLLIHDVDYVLHVLGPPLAVRATGHEDRDRGIDLITAVFSFAGGATATVAGGWALDGTVPLSMDLRLIAERGAIEYDPVEDAVDVHPSDAPPWRPEVAPASPFEAELEYFAGCAESGSPPARCPPVESAAAVRAAEAILESRRRDGHAVTLG